MIEKDSTGNTARQERVKGDAEQEGSEDCHGGRTMQWWTVKTAGTRGSEKVEKQDYEKNETVKNIEIIRSKMEKGRNAFDWKGNQGVNNAAVGKQ